MISALINWLHSEWRLMRLDTWEREDMTVPARPDFHPCSSEDPRCAETIRRLAECRERMKRMKAGVLDGRAVTCSASTDVAATMRRARAVAMVPVRAVPARRSAR